MAFLLRGAALALIAACVFHAAPASADIEVKAGCDGKWMPREGSNFETYMICEHAHSALRARASRSSAAKRAAHARRVRAREAHVVHRHVAPKPEVVVAAVSLRRDLECLILTCPQFLLTGVGY